MAEHSVEVDPQALQRCAKVLKESSGPLGSVSSELPESYSGSWPSGLVPGAEEFNAAVTKLLDTLKSDSGLLKDLLEKGERSLDQAQGQYTSTSEQISADAKKVSADIGEES